jgi:hypothetical protein
MQQQSNKWDVSNPRSNFIPDWLIYKQDLVIHMVLWKYKTNTIYDGAIKEAKEMLRTPLEVGKWLKSHRLQSQCA